MISLSLLSKFVLHSFCCIITSWALIPVILAKLLQSDPTLHTPDEASVEKLLVSVILEFLQFAHNYQRHQQQMHDSYTAANSSSNGELIRSFAMFSGELLVHLSQCIRSVIVSYSMDKQQLRVTLLSNRGRAEVVHTMVLMGDEVSAVSPQHPLAVEWTSRRETVMCMLDG